MRRTIIGPILFVLALAVLAAPASAGSKDGKYVGKFDSPGSKYGTIKFTVKKGGKRITKFGTTVGAACYSPTSGLRFEPIVVGFGKIKVNGNGTFEKTEELGDSETGPYQTYSVSGKLNNNKVKNGRITLGGRCTAGKDFVAKRKG